MKNLRLNTLFMNIILDKIAQNSKEEKNKYNNANNNVLYMCVVIVALHTTSTK